MMHGRQCLSFLFTVAVLLTSCGETPRSEKVPEVRADLPDRFINAIGMPMILVRGGTFEMGVNGDPLGTGLGASYSPRHQVTLSDFYLAKYEVTKGVFRQFVAETGIGADLPELDPMATVERPDDYDRHLVFSKAPGDEYPIYRCDWITAMKFCEWLSKKEGRTYRLPYEAEWEYAARSGTDTGQWWYSTVKKPRVPPDTYAAHGNPISDTAYLRGCAPPGAYPANPWGFYDMLGNAKEWCMDRYAEQYPSTPQRDPTGPRFGEERIIRGGGVGSSVFALNAYFHGPGVPESRQAGIRLVCVIDRAFSLLAPLPLELVPPQPVAVDPLPSVTARLPGEVPLELLVVPAGLVLLGSPSNERGRGYHNEGPQTQVEIVQPFLLGRFEVTQRQYEAVMGVNPSVFKHPDHPVEAVARPDVLAFSKRLTEYERAAGRLPVDGAYRLPTEEEWEYACRAGTATAFSFGENSELLGWYGVYDVLGGTQKVGGKWPNPWGFFDFHGNVQEMCESRLGVYPGGRVQVPYRTKRRAGTYWVCRGGSWNTGWIPCRSAARRAIWYNLDDADRCEFIGFRLARTLGMEEINEFEAKGLLKSRSK